MSDLTTAEERYEERIAWVSPSRLAFMRFVFRHFPESFRKGIADNFGYFWKKCPRCEKEFGGFEVAGGGQNMIRYPGKGYKFGSELDGVEGISNPTKKQYIEPRFSYQEAWAMEMARAHKNTWLLWASLMGNFR